MLYARGGDGRRVSAVPGIQAACPSCKSVVIAKCGDVVVHHFAHKSAEDCDRWSEGESDWHAGWKMRWAEEYREHVFGNRHRADVYSFGYVVELQHSGIGVAEIEEREAFYGKEAACGMVWLFDATEAVDGERFRTEPEGPAGAPIQHNFFWFQSRKTIAACRAPLFLDIGNGEVFHVRKFHPGPLTRGWGHILTAEEFVRRYTEPAPRPGMEAPADLFGAL